jgi:hypothetical protein
VLAPNFGYGKRGVSEQGAIVLGKQALSVARTRHKTLSHADTPPPMHGVHRNDRILAPVACVACAVACLFLSRKLEGSTAERMQEGIRGRGWGNPQPLAHFFPHRRRLTVTSQLARAPTPLSACAYLAWAAYVAAGVNKHHHHHHQRQGGFCRAPQGQNAHTSPAPTLVTVAPTPSCHSRD